MHNVGLVFLEQGRQFTATLYIRKGGQLSLQAVSVVWNVLTLELTAVFGSDSADIESAFTERMKQRYPLVDVIAADMPDSRLQ